MASELKAKVGDRVRVVRIRENDVNELTKRLVGRVGTVDVVDSDHVDVYFDGGDLRWFYPDELEVIDVNDEQS